MQDDEAIVTIQSACRPLAQARPRGAAHSSQNLAPSSFSWRHFGHFIKGPETSPNGS
jgi:hypothetical protein